MRTLAQIDAELTALEKDADAVAKARSLLALGEDVLENWIAARDETPTDELREGFRVLALHRQGAKGDPSFNACRETCRELVYHYNLVTLDPGHEHVDKRAEMMRLVAMHLYLFISGKMQVAGLGEFCCASKPIRTAAVEMS